jgi:hypothetical protein
MLAEAINATRSEVLSAIRQAAAATGSDFQYLVGTAMRESSLRPEAKAATSSASGLYQFTQQTWLGMIKQHGAQFGLGSYAAAITQDSDGRYHVSDKGDRQAILALRNDPKTAALMEGEYANDTRCQLKGELGRDVCSGELYAAHFLGPQAACRLIRLNQSHPATDAAAAFPQAADANRSVFYHRDGTAKTVGEVYNWAVKQPSLAAGTLASLTSAATTKPGSTAAPTQGGLGLDLYGATDSETSLIPLASLPNTSFALTPGIMHILANMEPGQDSDQIS